MADYKKTGGYFLNCHKKLNKFSKDNLCKATKSNLGRFYFGNGQANNI